MGVNNNTHNEHANAKRDWQKARLLRSLLQEPYSQVTPVEASTYDFWRFYTILGATTMYSGKRTTTKETIITKSSRQQDSVVGHFVVFDHKGERRFGEVKNMKDPQLTVHLFRLV